MTVSNDDVQLSAYFNNYNYQSPLRAEYLCNPESEQFWFENHSDYTKVTANNYPKLYLAILDECKFRGIETPDCYIDNSGACRLAYADSEAYAIFVEPKAYKSFNQDEMRALVAHEIKHLYQGEPKNNKECRQNEIDADRAAVESTDYTTIRSYVHKAAALMIDEMIPESCQSLAHKFHETFPNLVSENFWLRIDEQHPSPAARMKAMHDWENTLQNEHDNKGIISLNLG